MGRQGRSHRHAAVTGEEPLVCDGQARFLKWSQNCGVLQPDVMSLVGQRVRHLRMMHGANRLHIDGHLYTQGAMNFESFQIEAHVHAY